MPTSLRIYNICISDTSDRRPHACIHPPRGPQLGDHIFLVDEFRERNIKYMIFTKCMYFNGGGARCLRSCSSRDSAHPPTSSVEFSTRGSRGRLPDAAGVAGDAARRFRDDAGDAARRFRDGAGDAARRDEHARGAARQRGGGVAGAGARARRNSRRGGELARSGDRRVGAGSATGAGAEQAGAGLAVAGRRRKSIGIIG